MKKSVLICVICGLTIFSGCNSQTASPENFNVVSVNGHFPQELVGTWKADKQPWQFTFDKNGNIVSFVHYFGSVEITPGQTTQKVMKEQDYMVYEPGQCVGQYTPDNRELAVYTDVTIDVGGMLTGQSVDTLVGKISDDFSTWTTEWFADPQLYVTDDKGNVPLPPDRPADVPVTLIFKKLSR